MSISPLLSISDYKELDIIYNENKDKPWNEWLEFHKTFEKPGKQGLVGLFKVKNKDLFFVFKVSQYINHLAQHEISIMKGLNKLMNFCPHFCKGIGTIKCKIDPNSRKSGNPFKPSCKYPIEKDILLTEFVDKSSKFYNYICSEKIPEDILYSSINQILLAIAFAQKKAKFAHYDLHSYNIMMKKCNKDVVFLYVLDEKNQFCIPTYGHFPVIIDFGFSYIQDLDNNPMWATLAHTDVGFTSDRFDWVSDPKLFLVTVSNEIREERKTKKAKRLRRIVKNIFNPLTIDWSSGWDDYEDSGATDYVMEMLSEYNTGSVLFDEYEHYCIDILQSLIILPLHEQNYTNIDKSYVGFLEEFVKIENEIGNHFYNLYILKEIIDSARSVRTDYMSKKEKEREWAVKTFKNDIFSKIQTISKFVQLKDVKFEKMLCSLLVLSRNIEGILYDVMIAKMQQKQKQYNKMPIKNIEQIIGILSINIPTEYTFNENTTVVVLNAIKEECTIYKIPEDQLDRINDTSFICKGTLIYDMIKQTSPDS